MESNEQKSCPMCCKAIPHSAKKCPYCLHFQNRIATIVSNPLFVMLIVIIPMMIMFSFLRLGFDDIFSDGEQYSDYPNALTVLDSKMSFGEKQCQDHIHETIVLLGTITNGSDIVWDDIHLEIKLFNENQELVDADQEEDFSLVVPSHDKATFKVYFDRQFPKEEYVSHTVRVLSASEKRGFLD